VFTLEFGRRKSLLAFLAVFWWTIPIETSAYLGIAEFTRYVVKSLVAFRFAFLADGWGIFPVAVDSHRCTAIFTIALIKLSRLFLAARFAQLRGVIPIVADTKVGSAFSA
jgi:hypothetical protein